MDDSKAKCSINTNPLSLFLLNAPDKQQKQITIR